MPPAKLYPVLDLATTMLYNYNQGMILCGLA